MTKSELLAIVCVDFENRVQCQQPRCGHSVYQRIHIVQEGGEHLVLGSTCFEKRFGSENILGASRHGGDKGRKLTAQERQLLVDNTAALLEQFERERRAELVLEHSRQVAIVVAPPSRVPPPTNAPPPTEVPRAALPSFQTPGKTPWPWQKPFTSIAYYQLRDGTGWMRVQRRDGQQILVPWPAFDGWEEALPARIGIPALELGGLVLFDLISTVRYLREHTEWEKVCGLWRDMREELAKRK